MIAGVNNPFAVGELCDRKVLNACFANACVAFWKCGVEASPERRMVCNKTVAGTVFAVCIVTREGSFVAVVSAVE